METFLNVIRKDGGLVDKVDIWGRRRLAYTIKKRNEATYHNFLFRAEAKAVAEVQRKMRLSESILRFLTVRVDEEMKHGQKVARNTKVRTPRPVPSLDGGYSHAPVAPPVEPAAPEAVKGEE